MPITQSIESPTQAGVTLASYSVNVRFVLDPIRRTIDLTTARWADKASFDAGKPPIAYHPYHLEGDAYTTHVTANATAYADVSRTIETFLLAQPEFAGGTEVA